MRFKRVMVTGGAGFLGSHMVALLVENDLAEEVVVYDNMSTGTAANIAHNLMLPGKRVTHRLGDVQDAEKLSSVMTGCDAVFHFAANADVRGGIDALSRDVSQNILATSTLLQCMHEHGIKFVVFASSAAVYGDADEFPTDIRAATPNRQTSLYGSTKLACEALLSAHREYFGLQYIALRLVSMLGPRYRHGVVIDLMRKLKDNPDRLALLGNGSAEKSYLHVNDFKAAVLAILDNHSDANGMSGTYNVGHLTTMPAFEVAEHVCAAMGLNPTITTLSPEPRGWIGDAPRVELDVSELRFLGWEPKLWIPDAIFDTVNYLKDKIAPEQIYEPPF